MAEDIVIIEGNTITHQLRLSDCGHTKAHKRATIEWKIKNNSNVASIELIVRKPGFPNIFSTDPYKVNDKKWRAVISEHARDYEECEYSIHWKAVGSNIQHEHDPKISVKPSNLAKIILKFILAIIFGLFAFKFLRKKDRR